MHISSFSHFPLTILPLLIATAVPTIWLQAQDTVAQGTIGLEEYKNNRLFNVVKVSSENNLLTVQGYCKKVDEVRAKPADSKFCESVAPDYRTLKIALNENEALHIGDRKVFYKSGYMQPLPISVITIPIKMRAAVDDHPTQVTGGFSNLGLNLDLIHHRTRRYFADENSTTHRSGIGIFLGPSVEQIDSTNSATDLAENEESRQFFVSTGLTLTYSYHNISFTMIPLGIDFATSSVGKKFRYDQKIWFGFGIGLRPQFFR